MLVDDIEHALVQPIGAIEHFALAVKNEFLEIKGDGFRNAKIFRILGDDYFHFFTDPEEMIDGIAAGEYHRGKCGNIDLLFAEFLDRNGFHLNERPKVNFQIELLNSGGIETRRDSDRLAVSP